MLPARRNQEKHLPELDGIRGLAILGVLCSHVAGMSGVLSINSPAPWEKVLLHITIPLWGGVDLFFVLSGFLITGILLRTNESKKYFSSFYMRRMLRIFPIYYLALTSCVVLGHFLGALNNLLPAWTSSKVAYFIYLQNWPVFWHGGKTMTGIWGVYWSLAVEEQFYFAWPLIIFLCSGKTLLRVCALAVPCAVALRIYLYYAYFGNEFGLLQLTSSRVDGLLMGSICAIYMYTHKKPLPMQWIIAAGISGSVVIGSIALWDRVELVATGKWMGLIGSTAFALLSLALIGASQHPLPWLKRILTLGWLRSAGKYSYGMYVYQLFLIHAIRSYLPNAKSGDFRDGLPFSFAVKMLVLFAEILLVYLAAKLSFELVEKRFLNLKRYFEPAGNVALRASAETPIVAG